jgi:hypothetical protein
METRSHFTLHISFSLFVPLHLSTHPPTMSSVSDHDDSPSQSETLAERSWFSADEICTTENTARIWRRCYRKRYMAQADCRRRRGRRNQVLFADKIRKHHALQEESDILKCENQKLRGRLDQLECKLFAVYSTLRLTVASA